MGNEDSGVQVASFWYDGPPILGDEMSVLAPELKDISEGGDVIISGLTQGYKVRVTQAIDSSGMVKIMFV